MSFKKKLNLERAKIRFIKRENIRSKIGKYILLTLLIAIVYSEIQEIYAIMTTTSMVTVVNSQDETAVVLSQLGSSVIKTEQAVKPQGSSSHPDIEMMIRKSFPSAPECAVAVAKCESGLEPSRIGDTHMEKYSYGLFQINQTWHPYSEETLLNPQENVRIAKEIFDSFEKRTGNGWLAWSCYKNGNYIKYL